MTDHELLVHISKQLSSIESMLAGLTGLVFLIAILVWMRKDKQ